jgi:hypothetical protein
VPRACAAPVDGGPVTLATGLPGTFATFLAVDSKNVYYGSVSDSESQSAIGVGDGVRAGVKSPSPRQSPRQGAGRLMPLEWDGGTP